MRIDHDKLSAQSKELGDIIDGKMKANEAEPEVQHCLLLLTYHFAELVLSNQDQKAAFKKIPKEFREDVKAIAKQIKSQHTK